MTSPNLIGAPPPPHPGADGQIHHVVAACLQHVAVRAPSPPTAIVQATDPYGRDFDLAELIAWSCQLAGVRPVPPDRSDRLLLACRAARTVIEPAEALATKGALLFASDSGVGLSLGSRDRVIIYSPATGVIVDATGARTWVTGARVPGARGYR